MRGPTATQATCCRTWTEWWLNIRRHIKLAPSPQHLKQEKGKSREGEKGKRGSSQLVKTEEKEHALFSIPWEEFPLQRTLSRTYLVFSNWKQLIVKLHICLPQRQTRQACATFAGQTVSPGKPRRLFGTSAPEGEWTYNCLKGPFLSINGLFGTNMFLVEFGLVQVNTRIIEIWWHKSILLLGKSGTMFKMWWHFFIYIYIIHIF